MARRLVEQAADGNLPAKLSSHLRRRLITTLNTLCGTCSYTLPVYLPTAVLRSKLQSSDAAVLVHADLLDTHLNLPTPVALLRIATGTVRIDNVSRCTYTYFLFLSLKLVIHETNVEFAKRSRDELVNVRPLHICLSRDLPRQTADSAHRRLSPTPPSSLSPARPPAWSFSIN